MSPRTRFWTISLVTFVISCGLIWLTATNVGADPLHPRSRHIWALSLVAAAYASIRIAMVVNRLIEAQEAGDGSFLSGVPFFGGKQHAIDRRMAERRARVEAAQKRSKDTTDSNEDSGDD